MNPKFTKTSSLIQVLARSCVGNLKARLWSLNQYMSQSWSEMKGWLSPPDMANGIKPSTLGPRQKRRHFADNIFKCVSLNGNAWIPIEILLKFVLKDPTNNIPALVQIMDSCRSGDKPLSEPMMVGLPTHLCVTRSKSAKQLGRTFNPLGHSGTI